jgi:signal transduction histidine kinase
VRRRVLVLVAATTALVLVAFLVPLALLLRTVAADRAIQAAVTQAQTLSPLVSTTDRAALGVAVAQVDATAAADVSVFLPDGTVLGTPAPRTPLVEVGYRGRSASADVPGGREIVVAVRAAGGTGVIRAFVPDAVLTAGVTPAWFALGGLGAGLLLVSLLVADRLARRLVLATTDLAAVSRRLGAGELDARATGGPGELAVVADALNGLAGRIGTLLTEERETVADLAHQVRTPLTGLRLDAEALRDPVEAARITAGVEDVQRAVTHVIEQARRRRSDPGRCDAAEVVRERLAFWAVLAEDTERTTTVALADGPLPVALSAADLAAAVDALLGNVFAHTPDGTAFAVSLGADGAGARLVVEDAGPGLPPGVEVTRRGTSGAGSSGLGLDIARQAAARSGGRLTLGRSALGGVEAVLRLGTGQR